MNFNFIVDNGPKALARSVFLGLLLCSGIMELALADEPGPGMVYPKKAAPRHVEEVVVPPPVAREEPKPAPAVITEVPCDWGVRLAAGVPVWFFDKESNLPGAGGYVDFFSNEAQINFRIGVEGRHMYLTQEAAESAAEFTDKVTRITYIRIPFSVEYIVPIDHNVTQLFLGGGPDLIHTANDIESTDVGGHLSARLLHNLDENWGVAVEGGYMWGDARRPGKNVNLDGFYVTPTLNYTF